MYVYSKNHANKNHLTEEFFLLISGTYLYTFAKSCINIVTTINKHTIFKVLEQNIEK